MAIAARKMRRGAFAEAAAVLSAALELAPETAEAWLRLGEMHRREGCTNAAVGCYARGLEQVPGRVDLTIGLANAFTDAGRFDDAVAALSALADTHPDVPEYQFGCAHALHRAGRTADALAVLDKIVDKDPDAPMPRFSRSMMHLSLGHYAEGWRDYDMRHAADLDFRQTGLPLWDGAPAPGKRLLVVPEGGNGDIVWAARFLPAIRPMFASVHVALPPALLAVLADIEGADGVCRIDASDGFDLYCPILSLAARLRVSDPAAYPAARLTQAPDDDRQSRLLARAGNKMRVGIIWSGSETYSENRHRAAPLEAFLPLVENPDVQLFSLQKGQQQAVLREAGLGDLIIDADDFDFAETAALVQALDLVIMTDSAVAHIAGSLGAPVWVLLDCTPFWLFGQEGETSPWYPSMRLFRQSRPGDWQGLMVEVRAALDRHVENVRANR